MTVGTDEDKLGVMPVLGPVYGEAPMCGEAPNRISGDRIVPAAADGHMTPPGGIIITCGWLGCSIGEGVDNLFQ